MAYGLKYYSEFANALRLLDGSTLNEVFRFEIAEKDYTGESREITLGTPQPAIKYDEADDLGFGIMATSLEFTLIAQNNLEFSDLIEANDTSYTVKLLKLENGAFVALFAGYLAPSGISRPYKNPNYTISCTAVDGLNNLKKNTFLTKFTDLQTLSVFNWLLRAILGFRIDDIGKEKIYIEFDIQAQLHDGVNTYYEANTFGLLQCQGASFVDKNNFEILEEILKAFNLRLYFYKYWRLERVSNYLADEISYYVLETIKADFLPVQKSAALKQSAIISRLKMENENVKIYGAEESRQNGLKGINLKQTYNPTKEIIPFEYKQEFYRYNESLLFNQPRYYLSVSAPDNFNCIGIKEANGKKLLFIGNCGEFRGQLTFKSNFALNIYSDFEINLSFAPLKSTSKYYTDVTIYLEDAYQGLNPDKYYIDANQIYNKNTPVSNQIDLSVDKPALSIKHSIANSILPVVNGAFFNLTIVFTCAYVLNSDKRSYNYIENIDLTKLETRVEEWDGTEIQYIINKDNRNEIKKEDFELGQYMQDDTTSLFVTNNRMLLSKYKSMLFVDNKPILKLKTPYFEGKHLFLLANELGNLNGKNRLVISGLFSKYIEPFNTIRVVGNKTLYFKGGTFDVINNRIDGEFIEIPEEELTYWVDQKKNKVITEEGKYIIVKMYGRN